MLGDGTEETKWREEQHFNVLPQASSVYVRQKGTGLRGRRRQIWKGIYRTYEATRPPPLSLKAFGICRPLMAPQSPIDGGSHARCVSIRSPEIRCGEAGTRPVFQHSHWIVRASLPVVGTKVGQAGFTQ